MKWLIKCLVTPFAYAGVLYLLSRIRHDFVLKPGGLVKVTGILLIIDLVLYYLLHLLVLPFQLITLFLLSFLFKWIINSIILWVTDKMTDDLEIMSIQSLLIGGAAISLMDFIITHVLKVLFP
jgi:uncharacterized membrane protein YvlD (DUF360 family)